VRAEHHQTPWKRKRHTVEQIIKKLRETAVLIAGSKTAEEATRQIAVSAPTHHRWKEQYGGQIIIPSNDSRSWRRKTTSSKSLWPSRPWTTRCARR